MAKDRTIACIHYINEGNCDLGKNCSFWGHCQICKTWKPIPGGKPIREDNRKQKLDRIMRKEKYE